jgi:3-(3-hydroxy-phenyl)propionate hydroxylase
MTERVAIIGNGPVGQTTALLLARWGIPSVLLDRRPARDLVGSKAICQQRDVLDIWSSIGAGAQIAAEGVTWTTARTFHRDHELFSYTFTESGRPAFPPFVNISQSRTEEILDALIAEQPLIDVRWAQPVVKISSESDGVRLTCAEGGVVEAAYAVLCAGSRAEDLRTMLGVDFPGRSFDDRFLICDIRADLPGWATERRFYFDPAWNPGRQVLVHPCPDSTFRIDWQVPSDYEESAQALDARIRQVIGDRPYEIIWKSVYRFQSRCADRLRVGRVLLAGDAAHLYSPFGARGLNSGVADAENAAWKLAFVLRGWASDALLESYHLERHAAGLENLAVTTATMDFLVPQSAEAAAHRRDVLARAATDPTARGLVDSGRLAEPFWYVDSPLTTPSAAHPFAGRPARGEVPSAGPGVLVPDGPVLDGRRVREVAREGFTLLIAPGTVVEGSFPVTLRIVEVEPDGELGRALGLRAGEVWVLRPDAHVAGVVPVSEVAAVLRRALG